MFGNDFFIYFFKKNGSYFSLTTGSPTHSVMLKMGVCCMDEFLCRAKTLIKNYNVITYSNSFKSWIDHSPDLIFKINQIIF